MPLDQNFVDLARREPPSRADVQARAIELSRNPSEQPSVAAVLGVSQAAVEALQGADENLLLTYNHGEWGALGGLGLNISHRDRIALVFGNDQGEGHVAQRLRNMIYPALAEHGLYAAFIVTDHPAHPVWNMIPEGWLRVFMPATRSNAARIQVGSWRTRAMIDEAPGPDWTQIDTDQGTTVGWRSSGQVRLRFNPLVGNNDRFSAAQADSRCAMIGELIGLIGADIDGVTRDADAPPFLNAWKQTISEADALCSYLTSSLAESPQQSVAEIRRAHANAQAQVDSIREQLRQAEERLAQASAELESVAVFEDAARRRTEISLQSLEEQLTQIRALPQVADAQLDMHDVGHEYRRAYNGRQPVIQVRCHPLILNCSGTLRLVAEPTFALPTRGAADPILIAPDGPGNGRAHPADVSFDEASIALAQAIGQGDYRAATAVVCGALARAPQSAPHANGFPAAPDGARAGWQIPSAAPQRTENDQQDRAHGGRTRTRRASSARRAVMAAATV